MALGTISAFRHGPMHCCYGAKGAIGRGLWVGEHYNEKNCAGSCYSGDGGLSGTCKISSSLSTAKQSWHTFIRHLRHGQKLRSAGRPGASQSDGRSRRHDRGGRTARQALFAAPSPGLTRLPQHLSRCARTLPAHSFTTGAAISHARQTEWGESYPNEWRFYHRPITIKSKPRMAIAPP
jgi:hypothetical protein